MQNRDRVYLIIIFVLLLVTIFLGTIYYLQVLKYEEYKLKYHIELGLNEQIIDSLSKTELLEKGIYVIPALSVSKNFPGFLSISIYNKFNEAKEFTFEFVPIAGNFLHENLQFKYNHEPALLLPGEKVAFVQLVSFDKSLKVSYYGNNWAEFNVIARTNGEFYGESQVKILVIPNQFD